MKNTTILGWVLWIIIIIHFVLLFFGSKYSSLASSILSIGVLLLLLNFLYLYRKDKEIFNFNRTISTRNFVSVIAMGLIVMAVFGLLIQTGIIKL